MEDTNNVTLLRGLLESIRNLNETIQSQLRIIESLRKRNNELSRQNKELLIGSQRQLKKAKIIPLK